MSLPLGNDFVSWTNSREHNLWKITLLRKYHYGVPRVLRTHGSSVNLEVCSISLLHFKFAHHFSRKTTFH